ncbi:unnamed protein product [Prorocentrum cordatum]|uniref:EF-hand domain-containing protein n=1 Tax=Prorocentrum cordatum TaxID=2364126 RepID=A0ABN9UUL3_9DINO|nr:unnamed protein product [Polarella glacialis]
MLCDEYDAESKESAGNVELKDRILAVCHKYQHSYQQVFHCKQVGAMESNRGGESVQWRRAHGRVQVIKTSGFSLATIMNNAAAGEDNPYTKEYAKYTVKQCAKHPCFAKYQEDEIRIGAWGATHGLHGFACVHDRVKSEYESLTKDGYMDLDVVCNRDKRGLLRDAIANGVKFTVVKWVVHAALPMVAKIVGDALNTVQQTSEGETWFQNLLSIIDAASSMGAQPDWKAVAKKVLKSQPPRAMDIPDMVDYIIKWGGMPSGGLIEELAPLLNHYVPSDRVVSGLFFKQLAELKFPTGCMPAHVVNAVLFRHAAAEDCVRDGFAGYVTKPDLAMLSKPDKRQAVTQANGALMRAKAMLEEVELDPSVKESLKGQLMIDVVDFLMDKQDKAKIKGAGSDGKGKDATGKKGLVAILEEFIAKLDGNPGDGPTHPSEDGAASSALAANFVQYTDGGEASGLGQTTALNKDIVVGAHLRLRKPSEGTPLAMVDIWKIADVSGNGTVTFKNLKFDGTLDGDSITSKPLQEVEELFQTCKAREFMANYPHCDAVNDKDCITFELKSMIFAALNALHRKHGVQRARPMKKPVRAVLATKELGIGCYVAAPGTRSVVPQTKDVAACPPRALEVSAPVDGAPKMFIMPSPPADEFVSQYWCLSVESDRAKCNCELTMLTAKAKRPVVGEKMTGPTIDITIPCATNFKKVAEHEEPVLNLEAVATTKKAKISEPVLQSKRARKSA